MRVLSTLEWQARADAHRARVTPYTMPWRERRARKAVHPVYDFLFQYYPYSPGKLEAWHPNPGECLPDAPDACAMSAADRDRLTRTREVLRATHARPANFGCFGLHEWAMVYQGTEVRHQATAPLRLPQADVDAFVESRPITCSHFDAFRFFAPAAKPLNRLPLAWEARYDHEQPGCIHANMDLYRWAYTSMPWIGSDLLAECFLLAVALRELDMEAAPYDLSAFGVTPVRIETAEGREDYQSRQRALATRARAVRARLIDAISAALTPGPAVS